jgi:protoheme IX farnesyltransferase
MMLTFGGYTGHRYLVAAILTGLFWLCTAWSGYTRGDDPVWARRLFISSILIITLLSAMMSIDFKTPAIPDMLLAYKP